MLLISGLGNPGPKHQKQRHNVGFMAVDEIHRHGDFTPWKSRFQAMTAEGTLGGKKTLLLKPNTFMNESGRAVGEAKRFFKMDLADIVVLYDELDLAPGKTYAIWFNSKKFYAFRDTDNNPAIPYLLVFHTKE